MTDLIQALGPLVFGALIVTTVVMELALWKGTDWGKCKADSSLLEYLAVGAFSRGLLERYVKEKWKKRVLFLRSAALSLLVASLALVLIDPVLLNRGNEASTLVRKAEQYFAEREDAIRVVLQEYAASGYRRVAHGGVSGDLSVSRESYGPTKSISGENASALRGLLEDAGVIEMFTDDETMNVHFPLAPQYVGGKLFLLEFVVADTDNMPDLAQCGESDYAASGGCLSSLSAGWWLYVRWFERDP